jgi:DNA processing protein
LEDPALYKLALTRIHGIGSVYTKLLIDRFGDARAVFHAGRSSLARAGIHEKLVDAILQFSRYAPLEKELQIQKRKGIRMLFFTDPDYPRRLLTMHNFPPLLFYRGVADLNTEKIISVVGTRRPTDQGRQITKRLIRELAQPNLLIISGLAFGIDATAHTAALEHRIPTIGILGHGLGHLYPGEHSGLARSMQQQGGLLTSFPYHTKTEVHNFPIRNKLIAGLCDALIVVETGEVGGSLITAAEAQDLSKKIFAVPGRITDEKSRGCLHLIRGQKAELLVSGEQLQASMGWEWPTGRKGQQASLPFPSDAPVPVSTSTSTEHPEHLHQREHPEQPIHAEHPEQPAAAEQHSIHEQHLLSLLREKETLSIDELATFSQLNLSSIPLFLLNLEMQGLIRSLPGKRYRLAH